MTKKNILKCRQIIEQSVTGLTTMGHRVEQRGDKNDQRRINL